MVAQAGRLAAHVEARPELAPADVGLSLAVGRSRLEHGAVVVGGDRGALLAGLDAVVRGEPAEGVVDAVVSGGVSGGSVGFVFPGQGAQWLGMGLELSEGSPVFARGLEEAAAAVEELVDWRVVDVLGGVDGAPGLERVDVVQPVSFVMSVALAGLWRSFGVEPSVVVGHSQGEIAAACVAGGLSLEDAARVVVLRSRALVEIAGEGGMVSVAGSETDVAARIGGLGDLSVAAVNGPRSVVVSGGVAALDELLAGCEADGVWARRIPVDYASHSVHVEAIHDRLLADLATIQPRTGDVPFMSALEGELVDTARLDADYWYRNLRETVRFQDATRVLLEDGVRAFVEVSPHPVLTMAVEETVEDSDADPDDTLITGTLRRDDGGQDRFLTSLGQAHARGVEVDWAKLFDDTDAKRVALPTYPFQRRRYWVASGGGPGDLGSVGLASADHPMLGAMVGRGEGDRTLFTGRVSAGAQPWLEDHVVSGSVLVPGTALVELVAFAGREVGCEVVEELSLEAPLVVAEDGAAQVQVAVGEPDDAGRREAELFARSEGGDRDEGWVRHASGTVTAGEPAVDPAVVEELAGEWPPLDAEPVAVESLYDDVAAIGLEYGPAFQGLRAAWRRGDEIFVDVELADEQVGEAGGYGVHPALLDGALHGTFLLQGDDGLAGDGGLRLPFAWTGVRLGARGASTLRVRLMPEG